MPKTEEALHHLHESEQKFPAPDNAERPPLINKKHYEDMYRQSLTDPDKFWGEQATRLSWFKKWNKVKNASFEGDISIKWYEGGQLNVSYNCIDRHLEKNGDQTAIIWEGDDPKESKHISYKKLHREVCKLANVLKSNGVKKGDVVTIYMPMIPETAYAMLACTRIGAIHSVVFGGFSPEALKGRIQDCNSRFVITADEGVRGGKKVPLKSNVDVAIKSLSSPLEGEQASGASKDANASRGGTLGGTQISPHASPSAQSLGSAAPPQGGSYIKKVLVVRRTGGTIDWNDSQDIWYHEEMAKASTECAPEKMDAEDPLFILYTSGSTGKPKGVLHTTGGYLVYVSFTHQVIFDYQPGDIYWCTADVGWVTGHSYIVYGPLANAATTLMFEGVPNYPNNSRFWEVVDKHKVTQFYTAPTALRALMAHGKDPVTATSRKTLRVLGSVGEPINPEAWLWYYNVVGDKRCPIVDTWWQTETGGFLLTPFPYATDLKPGSATFPFFGVKPAIVDDKGNILEGEAEGALCFLDSWPGQMRTVYGDHKRFKETYFKDYPGKYFSGDGARRDKDGYYWIIGRMDDVINVSGHRLGTAEIESALVAHKKVAEAAVVGYPHKVKGQGIYAFVTLNVGLKPSDALKDELREWVKKEIGAIARPDLIQWAPGLPKTRSGKIMRRICRKIANNEVDSLGETSTLLNPEAVDDLIQNRLNK